MTACGSCLTASYPHEIRLSLTCKPPASHGKRCFGFKHTVDGGIRKAAKLSHRTTQLLVISQIPMRLTESQVNAIRTTAREAFGDRSCVWLFGSRVHDHKRGGDIDLLIRPDANLTSPFFRHRIKFLTKLVPLLGDRKVDVIVAGPDDSRPIVQIARDTGVRL